jgi:hypothetical protein
MNVRRGYCMLKRGVASATQAAQPGTPFQKGVAQPDDRCGQARPKVDPSYAKGILSARTKRCCLAKAGADLWGNWDFEPPPGLKNG